MIGKVQCRRQVHVAMANMVPYGHTPIRMTGIAPRARRQGATCSQSAPHYGHEPQLPVQHLAAQ